MSTHTDVNNRKALRSGIVASLIAVVAVLTGCSASGDSYSDAGAEQAWAEEPAFRDGDSSEGGDGARPLSDNRAVIITGTMYMTVEDPIVAADRAAGIVKNAGGRIDARSETAPDENYGGSAALTLRIPSAKLDAVIDDIRDLGQVDEYSTDSYDVTNEVTDLAAKISTLRASTERIEGLLADAQNISDIITLERELDGRQAELEALEARQRGLTDQVSMSTIELSLTTEPVVILVEDDSPENFWDGLESGWGALVAFISGALIILGVLLPWLALMALIALAIILPIRARTSRTARRDAMPLESAPPPNVPAPPK